MPQKAIIDQNGYLNLYRNNIPRIQYCPFTTRPFLVKWFNFRPKAEYKWAGGRCGDWCPLFAENDTEKTVRLKCAIDQKITIESDLRGK